MMRRRTFFSSSSACLCVRGGGAESAPGDKGAWERSEIPSYASDGRTAPLQLSDEARREREEKEGDAVVLRVAQEPAFEEAAQNFVCLFWSFASLCTRRGWDCGAAYDGRCTPTRLTRTSLSTDRSGGEGF